MIQNVVFLFIVLSPLLWLAWNLIPSYNIYHMPSVPVLPYIYSFIKREPNDERIKRLVLPLLVKHGVAKLWIGQWIVIVYDGRKIKDMLKKTDIFPKKSLFSNSPHSKANKLLGNNIVFTSGEEWKKHRKVVNPAFHRSWSTELIGCCCENLLDKIKSMEGPIEVLTIFKEMSLDALGKAVFNFDFEAVKNPEGKYVSLYTKIIEEFQQPLFFYFPILDNLTSHVIKEPHERIEEFRKFISDMLDEKKKYLIENPSLCSDRADLLTLMVKATQELNENGVPLLTKKELIDDSIVFFIAGHDTIANTLSYTMYYLSKNPKIQRKAREEVLSIMSEEKRVPTLEEAKKMTYLTAMIHESMRVSPTVGMLTREVGEDYEVAPGVVLKKGQAVGIHLNAMHHNPKYWHKPDEFNPERFLTYSLDENGKPRMEFNKQATKTWFPFGGGPRTCIGMSFAILELQVMVSMLLSRFEIQIPENSPHFDKVISNTGGLSCPLNLELDFVPI